MSGKRLFRARASRRRPVARAARFLWLCGLACLWPALARADAVTDWNQELQSLIGRSSANLVDGPPEVAREMAIVTSAMFDAVNAASGLPYQPTAYAGPAVSGVSLDAAALTAGYQAVVGIVTDAAWQSATGKPTADTILSLTNQYYAGKLAALGIPQGNPAVPNLSACQSPAASLTAICGGVALGNAAATAILAKRANDGSQTAILNGLIPQAPPGSGTVPGVYVPPSATGGRPEMFPLWGSVTPMSLTLAAAASILANVPGPPAINSAAYAAGLLRTECQGGVRPLPTSVKLACAAAGIAPATAAQAKAALFWNDPGGTLQPPGHWLQITNTVIQSQHLDTLKAARLSMLVSQAEADAGILAWGIKYADNLWRPVTAIRNCASGATGGVAWNAFFNSCDSVWLSLIATPPHPDYVAGHPAFSGAAATVLANFLGTDAIPFTSVSDSYCNVGTAWRGTAGTIEACTVATTSFFAYQGQNTIYSLDGLGLPAVCADIGGVYNPAPQSCALNGTTYVWSPLKSGCDGIVKPGGTNDSPLICPITESFASFSEAVTGPNGSQLSRVYGGIHTPFAAADATVLGDAIGQAISVQAGIPEPATLALLAVSLGLLARVRRRRAESGETRDIR